jgi:hypothetical protein
MVARNDWAVLVGRQRRDGAAVDQRLPVGIDGGADGRVAAVDPHRRTEVAGGDRVVVVAEELGSQAVGAGAVDLKVSELVDVLNVVVSGFLPLDIFGRPGRVCY